MKEVEEVKKVEEVEEVKKTRTDFPAFCILLADFPN
jgi:hypothetical protein